MRLLVTGGMGLLGESVAVKALHAGWTVTATYHTTPHARLNERDDVSSIVWRQLDIVDPDAVDALMDEVRPDAIVHTAYRQSGPLMWATTARGAAHVARAAERTGARLVHLSSDALFDGRSSPYHEDAPPHPITPYGAAKAAGETAVAIAAPDAVIVRTSLIVCRDHPDQHSRMALDIADGKRSDVLFTDEYRCPIAVEDLADAILELVMLPYRGVLNVAGPDAVSRHELGRLVAARHGVDPAILPRGTVAALSLIRPTDVRLDCTRARGLLSTPLRGIREYLA